ncbi:MAG: NosD domain-containing protein, partial [Rhodothermales bacterium]
NRFVDNWGPSAFGLLLKDITDSRIEGNVIEGNTVGIYAEGVNRVQVMHNDFVENGRAVKLLANSMETEFRANNFVANTFDVTTNSRQSYSTFEGNYWDAYRGYDLDRDGTGDVPFYPVRLFALIVERNEPAIILMRSLFVHLMDAAERVLPTLTPKAVVDERPLMKRARTPDLHAAQSPIIPQPS